MQFKEWNWRRFPQNSIERASWICCCAVWHMAYNRREDLPPDISWHTRTLQFYSVLFCSVLLSFLRTNERRVASQSRHNRIDSVWKPVVPSCDTTKVKVRRIWVTGNHIICDAIDMLWIESNRLCNFRKPYVLAPVISRNQKLAQVSSRLTRVLYQFTTIFLHDLIDFILFQFCFVLLILVGIFHFSFSFIFRIMFFVYGILYGTETMWRAGGWRGAGDIEVVMDY